MSIEDGNVPPWRDGTVERRSWISNHDPHFELRATDDGYELHHPDFPVVEISGENGIYYAMDVAEGVIVRGKQGVSPGSFLRASDER
jgi:hypothetical protein